MGKKVFFSFFFHIYFPLLKLTLLGALPHPLGVLRRKLHSANFYNIPYLVLQCPNYITKKRIKNFFYLRRSFQSPSLLGFFDITTI